MYKKTEETKEYNIGWVLPAIMITALTGLLIFVAIAVLPKGWDKKAMVDCNNWKAQSAQYENFFLAEWQDMQCKALGIVIDAPVK